MGPKFCPGAVPSLWWHSLVTGRAGLKWHRKEPARGVWHGGRNGSDVLGVTIIPWDPQPSSLGSHPSPGHPCLSGVPIPFRPPRSLWVPISPQGLHPSWKSLAFLASLSEVPNPPWAPYPSPQSLSLPVVPVPPWCPHPSPGLPLSRSVPIPPVLPSFFLDSCSQAELLASLTKLGGFLLLQVSV